MLQKHQYTYRAIFSTRRPALPDPKQDPDSGVGAETSLKVGSETNHFGSTTLYMRPILFIIKAHNFSISGMQYSVLLQQQLSWVYWKSLFGRCKYMLFISSTASAAKKKDKICTNFGYVFFLHCSQRKYRYRITVHQLDIMNHDVLYFF